MTHLFTVDVEEHFQVHALERYVSRADWPRMESRVEGSVDRVLALLAEAGATATFFVLGWLAERQPWLVRRISSAGHEVASHGWAHRRVFALTREEFREELRRSKGVLEEIAGRRVLGFRAPSFSIVPGMEWAFDALLEEGYVYDSSVFPIRRPGYGYPGAPRDPHALRLAHGELIELPLNVLSLGRFHIPAAGGGYLRHLPYGVVRAAFRQQSRRGVPGVFFMHPWELDPAQPRLRVSGLTGLRHYGGLLRMEGRVRRLLREFRFTSIASHPALPLERRTAAAPAPVPAELPQLSA